MVGAVEQAAFGQRLRRHRRGPAPSRRRPASSSRSFWPAPTSITSLRRARGLEDVERQVGDRLGGRIDRVRRHRSPSRAARAPRRSRARRPGVRSARGALAASARDLEHAGDAERVVVGAGADRAPLRVGRADAVGVPVRAEHDDLVRARRAREAWRARCGSRRASTRDRQVGGEAPLQRDRAEVAAARAPCAAAARSRPDAANSRVAARALDPALQQHARRRVRRGRCRNSRRRAR